MKEPRLRTVDKANPPYPLNRFPASFAHIVGREVIYLLASSRHPALEGPEWERIFAKAIDAEWKPSNVGLDDIVKGAFAWGAKTVKVGSPHEAAAVRLISGRNNPEYSFDTIADSDDGIGAQVLQIWNARVDAIRDKFKEVRTVVLLKPADFAGERSPFTVFEFETVRYPVDAYEWRLNANANFEGFDKRSGDHKFTWQRHGSQFTIKEPVPDERLRFFVRKPPTLDDDQVLNLVGFDPSWIEVVGS
jgi:hypothetical protein